MPGFLGHLAVPAGFDMALYTSWKVSHHTNIITIIMMKCAWLEGM